MSSGVSMNVLPGSLSALCLAQRSAWGGARAGQVEMSEQACLSRERGNGLPLVSVRSSGICGKYQVER